MIKLYINSRFGKKIRKEILEKIHDSLEDRTNKFCCHVRHGYNLLICWKNLKEVKENMNSIQLDSEIRNDKKYQTCEHAWFSCRERRIAFIEECLNKLEQ